MGLMRRRRTFVPGVGGGGGFGYDPVAAGLTLAFESGLSNLSGITTPAAFGDFVSASNATAPVSPPDTHRITYPGGIASNGDGGGTLAFEPGSVTWRRLYVRWWMRLSLTYACHSHFAGEKLFYPVGRNAANGVINNSCNMTLITEPANTEDTQTLPMRWWLTPQTAGSPANYAQPLNGVYIVRDTWLPMEVLMTGNSSANGDGRFQAWLDGEPMADIDGLTFFDGGGYWDNIRFTGTRGGGVSDFLTPPEGQFREFDHMIAYTSEARS